MPDFGKSSRSCVARTRQSIIKGRLLRKYNLAVTRKRPAGRGTIGAGRAFSGLRFAAIGADDTMRSPAPRL